MAGRLQLALACSIASADHTAVTSTSTPASYHKVHGGQEMQRLLVEGMEEEVVLGHSDVRCCSSNVGKFSMPRYSMGSLMAQKHVCTKGR